ncbi:MAG: cation-translocating P-type ATPase [Lactobacillus sp.]|jgi:calcium-translocating P-type ATPase|nr:cation-translocating P-type ATPase [Lactobacillus sp.]MCI2032360.1 cation-translocating P-type ATPase [Lactobacillus sp.]
MTRVNDKWFRSDPQDTADHFKSDLTQGLSPSQVSANRDHYGENRLVEAPKPAWWRRLAGHLSDITVLVLLFAFCLSLYLALVADSGWVKPVVIGGIIALNTGLSLYQEGRAEKALASLQALNERTTLVIRAGERQVVPSQALVAGDVIVLKAGDTVPADACLITATALTADEAMLTGESEPVAKDASGPALFSGTAILSGTATAIVVGTGMQTEIGAIAAMLNHTHATRTPLAERLTQLGRRLSLVAVAGGGLVILLAVYRQQDDFLTSLMLGVGLAIAAVPESLPVIVTLSMTAGVQTMAKQHAIVRRITAVETIGNVTVIASDKTGTLTQNQMVATHLWPGAGAVRELHDQPELTADVLRPWGLANATTVASDGALLGDPTDTAIYRLLAETTTLTALTEAYPQVAVDPFDSTKKRMATLHTHDGRWLAVVKGAFDRLDFASGRAVAQRRHDEMAAQGLRIIAAGTKWFDHDPGADWLKQLDQLHLSGLIGIMDPPRPEVPQAIATAQRSGIRTVMITGDHLETASAIAEQIGILQPGTQAITGTQLADWSDAELADQIGTISVFARTTPADKLRIVECWQAQGEVVAMTGDGVNDAPALRQADVGIAMGITGTDVAKNAADIVLTDDNFATIVRAVRQGRTVYQNITKAVEFLVSVNFAQIFTMITAVLLGWGGVLSAEQMLIINVLADGIPGFFLSRERAEPGIMAMPPLDRHASIWHAGLGKRVAVRTTTYVGLILGIYALGRFSFGGGPALGTTLLFFVLAMGSVLDLFPIKSRRKMTWHTFTNNRPLAFSIAAILLALVAIGNFPPISQALGLVSLSLAQWLLVLAASLLPMIVVEAYKRRQHAGDLQHWVVAED